MNPTALCRILLSACTIAILPSCEGIPGEYGGASYGGDYDTGFEYSNYYSRPVYAGSVGGYYSTGYSRPGYGGGYGGYRGGYGGPRYYNTGYHRYNNNQYDSSHRSSYDHNHDYDRGRGSSGNNNRGGGEAIRLVKVRDGTRGNVPEGYHSKEYFQNRGISLSKNTYETRDGDRRGYSGSSSGKKKNH